MPASLMKRLTVALVALAIPLASATAGEESPAQDERTLVVVGDDGARVSVEYRDGELTVVSEDEGRTSVHVVDVEQIGRLVADGLDEAFASLRDAQFDLHAGADNRIVFSHGDETVELDVSAILAEVSAALKDGFAGMDDEDWVVTRDRDRTDAELRRELRDLKREVRELRRELDRLSR